MGDMNKKTLPIFGDDIKSKIGGGGYRSVPWLIGQEQLRLLQQSKMIG